MGQFLPDLHEAYAYAATRIDQGDHSFDASVAQWSINFKGILTELAAKRHRMAGRGSPEQRSDYESLRLLRSKLAQISKASTQEYAGGTNTELRELQKDVDRLELSLSRGQLDTNHWKATVDVQKSMKPGEVAIDFMVVWMKTQDNAAWQQQILATTVHPKMPCRSFVLGSMQDMASTLNQLESKLTDKNAFEDELKYEKDPDREGAVDRVIQSLKPTLEALYSHLLQPMHKEIADCSSIYICPDADLWTIPWSCMIDDKGYLIESHSITNLISMRELLSSELLKGKNTQAVLAYHPDYNYRREEDNSSTRSHPVEESPDRGSLPVFGGQTSAASVSFGTSTTLPYDSAPDASMKSNWLRSD